MNEANVVFSFFFGAIGTSVGVLHFCGGVLTVIEPLLKATPSSSSSSLHSFVVLVGILVVYVLDRDETVIHSNLRVPPYRENRFLSWDRRFLFLQRSSRRE